MQIAGKGQGWDFNLSSLALSCAIEFLKEI